MKKPLTVPRINPNDDQVELVAWHFETGDSVKMGEEICEFSTSKANFIFESPESGHLKIIRRTGERLRVGEILAYLCPTEEEARQVDEKSEIHRGSTVFSQRARELMMLHNLSEADFAGKKTVTEKDIQARVSRAFATPLAKEAEIQILSVAYQQALRSSLKVAFPAQGFLARMAQIKVKTVAGLAFACSRAIEKNQWILKEFGNSSVAATLNYAMDLGQGIKPMFAENFFSWTIQKWDQQIVEWGLKISRGQLNSNDLKLGRITITDLSPLGVHTFEPLLVGSQSAIIGLGSDYLNGQMNFISVNLSFDHRVHSGRQCALFLQDLQSVFVNL